MRGGDVTAYAVQSFRDGRWVIRRFAQLGTARSFATRETVRMQCGLSVHRVNPDLSTDVLLASGEWSRL